MSFSKRATRTPDVVDQWLESHGYYRKHTARDSTCLFRAVSEQIFLTQKYHEKVRADCVNYMRMNKFLFQKDIVGPIEDYLDAMSGLNEFGGPLEIIAISKSYRRDVYIFEKTCQPENITNFGYDERILMFHHDRHYDSVFNKSYIQEAAFCQSLVYNILYKSVFKLPDVQYAVSQMLHESLVPNENKLHAGYLTQQNAINKPKKYEPSVAEGKQVEEEADPINTHCVLEDVAKCMFHGLNENKSGDCNIEELTNAVDEKDVEQSNKKNKFKLPRNKLIFLKNTSESMGAADGNGSEVADANNNRNETNYTSMIPEFVARLLNLTDFHATDPNISCVKQMLKGNLTPFPYKVAKALDPEIYRNIEFDTWNEIRRELRYGNWYNGGTNLQVGVKCLVKLSEGQLTWYHCHIQEMPPSDEPCLVFVEELGEKRTVPRNFLQPLPSGQAKPWALPYRHYRNLASTIQNSKLFAFAEYENKFKKSRMYKSRKVKDTNGNSCKGDAEHTFSSNTDDLACFDNNLSEASENDMDFKKYSKLHALTTFQNNESNMDIIAMPVSIMLDNPITSGNENVQQNNMISNEPYPSGVTYNSDTPSPNINQQPFAYPYHNPYMWQVNHSAQSNINVTYSNQYQNSSYMPSSDHDSGSVSIPIRGSQDHVQYVNRSENNQFSQYNLSSQQRMVREIGYPINFYANKSVLSNGADLPLNDAMTLRFFYNLGIDYFNMTYPRNHPNIETAYRNISNIVNGEHMESTTFESDQFCLDAHNILALESPVKDEMGNSSFADNKHSKSKQTNSNRQMGLAENASASHRLATPSASNSASNHEAFNNGAGIGTGIPNAEIATSTSSYMMAYTQVPGMYSTMVPCYPIEEGGNVYIAQYMGVPFGVVPPNSPASDQLVEQPNYPIPSSQTVYQPPSQTANFTNHHPPAGPGFYQNQIWYPTPQAASLQSVVIPQGPYNHSAYQQASSTNNNNGAT